MQGINNLLLATGLLQKLEILDPGTSRQFAVGEKLQATILAKEGNNYLLQAGARLFRAQSNLSLPPGGKLILYVAEQKDGKTILKLEASFVIKSLEGSEKNENIVRTRQTAARLAFAGELEIQDPRASRQFAVRERLQALVLSKEGDNYLLQAGARTFRAHSNQPLPPGENLILYVAEQKDGKTLLMIEKPAAAEALEGTAKNEYIARIRQLAAKFGFTGERELGQLLELLSKLPVDEQTGVRYLLDPHLAAAVIVPWSTEDSHRIKLELDQYKELTGNRQIWEVSLSVSFPALGSLEIVLKLIEGKTYVRIWAEQADTEALLRARLEEMDLEQAMIEIVPAKGGPLLPRQREENIDMRI